MMSGTTVGDARKLARQRRRLLDGDRAARDKRIEDTIIAALLAASRCEQARGQIFAAESEIAVAIAQLGGEDLSASQCAELLGLPMSEVRRISREHAGSVREVAATDEPVVRLLSASAPVVGAGSG